MSTDEFQLSLPKGGGSIGGIAESFSANAFSGTANFTIPISLSSARSGFAPSLSLRYSSGIGNGPFGIGWDCGLPEIVRKTEKGIPRYDDTDVFRISGADDLVPALVEDAAGNWQSEAISVGSFTVDRFVPRNEGRFSRIERWTRPDGDAHWRVTTRENLTSIFGRTANARVADPDDPRRVFRWLIEETYDRRGHHILYEYASDAPPQAPRIYERHRRYAQRYLRRILYGNAPDGLQAAQGPVRQATDHFDPLASRTRTYLLEAILDYGDIRGEAYPVPDPDIGVEQVNAQWTLREDPFSSWRPGFELRTLRRCRRVMMFHHFAELGGATLVRATEFDYSIDPQTRVSFLTGATARGYGKSASGATTARRLPPIAITYTAFEPHNQRYSTVRAGGGDIPSRRLYGNDISLIDLFGSGLPDFIQANLGGWRYWRNLGTGRFDLPRPMARAPAGVTLERAGVGDVQGDGRPDLLDHGGPLPGFYALSRDGDWETFRPYRTLPTLDLSDPNLRLIDLTGDGRSDALVTAPGALIWYECLGEDGFAAPVRIPSLHDLDLFPDFSFADPSGRVRVADMNGDGLADLVVVYDGAIHYWPNLGYGRFGRRVTMSGAPHFGAGFQPDRLFLADLDGSGGADLVYVEFDRVRYWRNQSGNGWSGEQVITGTPATTGGAGLKFADVFGTGTATLVWSYDLAPQASGNYKVLDFCGGVKPHLVSTLDNGLGATIRATYRPSTAFYLDDLAARRPWKTILPFPIHVLAQVETRDLISGSRLVTRYAYHHGCYDGREREFRGFACVDRFDAESFDLAGAPEPDLSTAFRSPPARVRTWYHPGLPIEPASGEQRSAFDLRAAFQSEFFAGDAQSFAVSDDWTVPQGDPREALRALRGKVLRVETTVVDADDASPCPISVTDESFRLTCVQPPTNANVGSYLATLAQSIAYQYEGDPDDPRVAQDIVLSHDPFGSPRDSVRVFYPRRDAPADLPEQQRLRISYEHAEHINQTGQRDAYFIGVTYETRRYEIIGMNWNTTRAFDAASFAAITADPGNFLIDDPTQAPANPTKRLFHWARKYFKKDSAAATLDPPDNLASRLPLGRIEPLALPYDAYEAAFSGGQLDRLYGTRLAGLSAAQLGGYHPHPAQGNAEAGAVGYYWIPSGRVAFDANGFFAAVSLQDPFGSVTTASRDPYALLLTNVVDAAGNTTSARNDYRVLQPYELADANGNLRQVAYDALGFVVGVAEMGKPLAGGGYEGDSLDDFMADLDATKVDAYFQDPVSQGASILGSATSRVVYDYGTFLRGDGPSSVGHVARTVHGVAGLNARIEHTITYGDGFGRILQSRILAESEAGQAGIARWTVSGATIYDNKGKPVRCFEPRFDTSHRYGPGEHGVASTLFLDPLGRVVATHNPDETYRKLIYTPWRTETWDANDTVLLDPRTDPDLAHFATSFFQAYDADFANRNGAPPWTWYAEHSAAGAPAPQQRAAALASAHAGTPRISHCDTQSRPFLEIADNGTETAENRVDWDIEGQPRGRTDAYGRTVLKAQYDLAGRKLAVQAMDAGLRLTFPDVAGKTLFRWDAIGARTEVRYDALGRVRETQVVDSSGTRLAQRTVYGEGQVNDTDLNLRGHVYTVEDEAGIETHERHDFKGNLTIMSRRLTRDHGTPDWQSNVPLLNETFRVETAYDALNRAVGKAFSRDGATGPYRQAVRYAGPNLVEGIDVALPGASFEAYVAGIEYNARGQRVAMSLGNGVVATYAYDPLTFRLVRVTAAKPGRAAVQDLDYTFDPAGNVVAIRDNAHATVFNHNSRIDPLSQFEYDPVYRLVSASGREHESSTRCSHRSAGRDAPSIDLDLTQPAANGRALVNYTESYRYDRAGNLTEIRHANGLGAAWTRTQVSVAGANRLASSDSGCPQEQGFAFTHDANGNILALPNTGPLDWNAFGRLSAVELRGGAAATADRVVFDYGFDGNRLRKVTERAGNKDEERLYFGAIEIYRRYQNGTLVFERETCGVMDGKVRIAEIDRRTIDTQQREQTAAVDVRYMLGNHTRSSLVETDANGERISAEEYYPYGGSAYQSQVTGRRARYKRYRFAGKECDSETGLYYFGARYYASWLGRWISPDSLAEAGGANLYEFLAGNPNSLIDEWGLASVVVNSVEEGLKLLGASVEAENAKWLASNNTYQPIEHALIFDATAPVGDRLKVISGHMSGVDVPAGSAAIAHTHPKNSSIPTNLDMEHIQATGATEHTIVTGKDTWTQIEFDPKTNTGRMSRFDSGRHVSTREIASFELNKPPNTPVKPGPAVAHASPPPGSTMKEVAKRLGDMSLDENAIARGTASKIATVAEGLEGASEVSRLRAVTTAVKGSLGTLARGGAVLLNAAGTAAALYQIGDGVSDIADGRTAEGANKSGFGAVGLAVDVGGAWAVKAGAMIAGGGTMAMAATGVAMGGSLFLAQQTIDAAIKGEETPYEVASDYWLNKTLEWTGHEP
jgi:RHS repeat-associated protein